jgi:hypothetical protein
MPSPFPGMDPYIEAEAWTSFHSSLATAIAYQLVPKLRPRYLAFPVERFVLDDPDDVSIETREIYPDVSAVDGGKAAPPRIATATINPPLKLETVVSRRTPHFSVEIRDAKNRRLVSAIEILSPTNKRGRGRREYLVKRRRIFSSSVHLLEIDLLRRGKRVPMRQPLPAAPYFVLVSRASSRPILDVWPIAFSDRLPTVPVPLLPGDADVELDLQAAFTEVFDRGGYDLAFDYSKPPESPLPTDAEVWADQLLRAAKLRQ